MIDLSKITFEELLAMKAEIDKEVEEFEGRRRREALEHLDKVAQDHGFMSADMVVNNRMDGRRKTVKKKFFNPENPDVQWSGRGRKPRWYLEALEKGFTDEDMAIKNSE